MPCSYLGAPGMKMCGELFPVIRGLLAHRKTFVTVEMVEEIRSLLGKIVSHASPPLRTVLKRVQADIKEREQLEAFGIIVSD